MAKNEFIKMGENIVANPKGTDYDLIPGKTYDLGWNKWNDQPIFKENGQLNLPKKIYTTTRDTIFKKRVLTYFNNANTNTTGVMLAGTKGTGKSLTAKVLAKESGLPIIIVSPEYPAHKLTHFFKQFETPVCIIFDEVEKNFQTNKMLDFLDGIEKTTKKLVIMTCNHLNKVSEYMQDRCSRIRYLRKYTPDENITFLEALASDLKIKNKDKVVEYCKNNISLLSIDNIVAFMNEIKIFEDEDFSLDDIIDIMNISTKKPITTSNESEIVENNESESSDIVDPEDYGDYDDDDGFDIVPDECCDAA